MPDPNSVPGQVHYEFTWRQRVNPGRQEMLTTPTFIIGLGGIGNAVARILRQRFLASDLGGLPATVFVRSVDTAAQSEEATTVDSLPPEMFTGIGEFSASQIVQNLNQHPTIRRWWRYPPDTFHAGFLTRGAGARRPLGRLSVFVAQNFMRVYQALASDFDRAKAQELQEHLRSKGLDAVRLHPRVYVVGSLAGGTCSGTFLDIAILVRRMLQDRGYNAGATEISGVLALPSVIHLRTGDGHTAVGTQRKVNAFAALRELDYLIRMPGGEHLHVEYPQPVGAVELVAPVYDHTFLFTDTMQNHYTLGRQEDVLLRAAHFLFGQIALGTGASTARVFVNVPQYFDPSQRTVGDGLTAVYASFGVEWLEVPQRQLIQAWCEEIGEGVGRAVAEFDWIAQPHRNLPQTLAGLMDESLGSYSTAFQLASARSENIAAVTGLKDVEPYLEAIRAATSRDDLDAAIGAFEVGVTTVLDRLQQQVARLPEPAAEKAWLQAMVRRLIADPAFRMGGARRVVEALASQLRAVSDVQTSDLEPRSAIVRRCVSGLLRRSVSSGPAVEWAQARTLELARLRMKERIGDRCAQFARRCDDMNRVLSSLQAAVREASSDLIGHIGGLPSDTPEEMRLLEPDAINQVIGDQVEDVKREVANRASFTLGEVLGEFERFDQPAEMPVFKVFFARMVVEAIRLEAAHRTKRPGDAVDRLKRRMASCSPLASVLSDGPEFYNVMSDVQRAVPLKIVVTGASDEERSAVEAWAATERDSAGDENAFQVAGTADPMRDDALYVSLGWPLCLFREVRECHQAYMTARREHRGMVEFSGVLGDIGGAVGHEIMPRPTAFARQMFAVAYVLGDLEFIRMREVRFAALVAGQEARIEVDPDHADEEALLHFRRSGFVNRYANELQASAERSPGALRERIRQGVQRKHDRLESLDPEAMIAADVAERLGQLCELATEYAATLVDV